MIDKIYFGRRQTFQKRQLNTQGCCFMCLKITDFKTKENEKDGKMEIKREPVTIKYLCRYLKLSTNNTKSQCKSKHSSNEDHNIEVDLCESCKRKINKFKSSFAKLEAMQIKVNYWVGRIHEEITESSKKPELVQIYSKRMTSNPESLSQLLIVDDLRKKIVNKTNSSLETFAEPRIKLLPLKTVEIEQYFRKPTPTKQLISDQILENDLEDDHQNDNSFSDIGDSEDIIGSMHKATVKPDTSTHSPDSPSCSIMLPRIETVRSLTKTTTRTYIKNCNTGTFDCLKCKKQYSTSEMARIHYDSVHLLKKYKCDICDKSFGYKKNLSFHKKTCRDSQKRRLENNRAKGLDPRYKFNCPTCKQKFKHHSRMKDHFEGSHMKKRKHSCDLCEKQFVHAGEMQKHKDAVHYGRTFPCKTCKKQFKWKAAVKFHEKKCTKVAIKSEIKTQQQQDILEDFR